MQPRQLHFPLTQAYNRDIPLFVDLFVEFKGFLNKRVRYAIESATARYPIIAIKLAMVEATNG